MPKHAEISLFLILTCCLFSAAGCDTEDTASYDVNISWTIGGLDICKTVLPENYGGGELDFSQIQISVYKKEGDIAPLREEIVPCAVHETTITGLARGSYFVKLGAIANYDDKELPYFHASGKIVAGSFEIDTFPFQLELGTGTVNVKWGFGDGGQCGEYGVVSITTSLISTGSRTKEYSHENLPCNPEAGALAGDTFQRVQWDVYNLVIEGFDSDGRLTHKGIATERVQVYPGQVKDADRIYLEEL